MKHFWFSRQYELAMQEADMIDTRRRDAFGLPDPWSVERRAMLANGDIVAYSFCADTATGCGAQWPDLVYVGPGRIYSIAGVVQR